ncbi:DegT/DnrJ/EryC1/StrS family aminotransferase [Helicobacter bizzozeronii]|uniref:DegT/DnrJ/EryC1/StrS family aminotransferase n=1 Tax=Helicobacter bizzozeronii TaxID=56877 RepID=UPI000CEE9E56|nr:DegT/DnrJ/EryC1/StrS family aminotransferase [Helicobacter bizzozeronii]
MCACLSLEPLDFYNLKALHQEHALEIEEALLQGARNAQYILGQEVTQLEQDLAKRAGFAFCLGTSSGTSSLLLAFLACGITRGDEVITPAFGFIAAVEMLLLLGAQPVLVDIDPATYQMDSLLVERAITPKTKAIVPLSLFGLASDRHALSQIAKAHNLFLIEDGAQSFLAPYEGSGKPDIFTTSFFPTKPLGCYGDGGAILCDDGDLYDKLKALRIHGQKGKYNHCYLGLNARLDALQACILKVKLKHYANHLKALRAKAQIYHQLLEPLGLQLPLDKINSHHSTRHNIYAQYPILHPKRAQLMAKLTQEHIPSAIHYPKPLHHQAPLEHLGYADRHFPNALKVCQEIISLPLNPYLTRLELEQVAQVVADV